MIQSKYFFQQFGEQIKEEVERFKAHEETTKLGKKRCSHKQAKIVDNEIRCSCGASWSGPGLNRLGQALKIDQ